MKKILLLIVLLSFILIGCDTIENSDLSPFRGCQIVSVNRCYSGDYTTFTAYCNGVFKKGVVPFRTTEITIIQKMIDDIKEDK